MYQTVFHAFGLQLPTGLANILHVFKIQIISWNTAHVKSHGFFSRTRTVAQKSIPYQAT